MVADPQDKQERADNDERHLVETWTRKVYRLTEDAIGSIGGLTAAAGVCVIDPGDLRRSLDRNGRRLSLDHALALATRTSRFNPALAVKIASAFVYPLSLEVFPRVTLTPEEENRRLKQMMRSMPLGEQLIEEALKKP